MGKTNVGGAGTMAVKQKPGHTIRNCDSCHRPYMADNRNLKRGWGLCCSKRCAGRVRELKAQK